MKNALLILAQTIVDPSSVNIPKPQASGSQIQTVLRIVFLTAGAVSVLMIVIGGLLYVTSNGDPQRTARAKDTILYAIIGLVVAILSSVIVVFVLGRVF